MSDQPITTQELDALQALCDGAAPGPWIVDNASGNIKAHNATVAYDTWAGREGAFIAAARTAMPGLITEVRRLRASAQNSEPVKYGRWVYDSGFWTCTNCGHDEPYRDDDDPDKPRFKRCTGCGAKMDATRAEATDADGRGN